jgi:hypothetical protein
MKKIAALLVIALTTVTLSASPLTGRPGQDPQQYILIVRYNPNAPKLSDDAVKANQQHWSAWIGQLAQGGKLVTAYRPAAGGKTISGTAKTAKDGPYAIDKEVVSSIFIIRTASQDEADAIAKTCPIYETGGSIEIRPITDTAH